MITNKWNKRKTIAVKIIGGYLFMNKGISCVA